MVATIVVLSGPVSSGKSTLARRLAERYGGTRFSTRQLLMSRLGGDPPDRDALQRLGDELDNEAGGSWVADALAREVALVPDTELVVVDSARIIGQVEALRSAFVGTDVVHVHLTAPGDALESRYEARRGTTEVQELASYADVQANATEAAIGTLALDADVVIDTLRCSPIDVEVRAASHLGFAARELPALIDVIIGGQYGSEGKGNIAFYLAPDYDLLVRVGGPNAGHKVYGPNGEIFTHRLLPSGTLATDAPILLGPGAVLHAETLLQEIADCKVDVDRLAIDPQAMLIDAKDIAGEARKGGVVSSIGSTGKGVGVATARRITDRGKLVGLARDSPELRPFTQRSATEVLEDALASGQRVLLEGTQGTSLSLYHGFYPYVTSRDTSVAGTLAEAGIAPRRVRKVVMVCRTYPIRVEDPPEGTSGPMSQEIDWETVAERSGYDAETLKATERGSVSGRLRRVGEFDWQLLRRNSHLNGATDIARTFVDYLDKQNENARRYEQLQPETIRFIEEVECVAGAQVSLISTRFHPRSIIDRRRW